MKMLVDPTWYFLLFWLPLYFRDVHKLEMNQIGWALPFIYFMPGAGSVIAGWANGRLLRRGWSLRRVRISGLLFCACIMPVAAYGAMQGDAFAAVMIFSLAAAAHQAFSSISFMLPADVFPSTAVGTGRSVRTWGLASICFTSARAANSSISARLPVT